MFSTTCFYIILILSAPEESGENKAFILQTWRTDKKWKKFKLEIISSAVWLNAACSPLERASKASVEFGPLLGGKRKASEGGGGGRKLDEGSIYNLLTLNISI